jgi:hypothetical protein
MALPTAFACNNDDAGGGDGTTDAGSSSGGATTTAGSTGVGGESTGAVASSSSGAADESSSGGLPSEVMMSGEIQDFFVGMPIAGAEISLQSDPSVATVSDVDGLWALAGLTPNVQDRLLIAGTDTYWGALIPLEVGAMDDDNVDLSQVSIEVVDLQEMALQNQEPTVIVDETKSAFLVVLRQNTAVGAGNGPVTVQLDPPPLPNTYYAPISATEPVLNLNEISWQVYPVMVFFNLEPGPEGVYTLSATHPDRECTFPDPSPPTLQRHINLVYVDCLPPA